jgi:CRISPR-associated endonuclease/helicase Cas3
VRALAGYEAADRQEKEARLPDFNVLWADRPDDLAASRRWAAESPKRFLAAPIAVGTIDQVLLAALRVRHAHLRHSLLARSLLVIDEVHASDAYMGALSENLLRAQLGAGGEALLLSATLGSVARARYQATLVRSAARPSSSPGLAAASLLPYPAISNGADTPRKVEGSRRQKDVHWKTWPVIDEPVVIAAKALEAARQGARVLVIRNTVPDAVAIFHAVESLAAAAGAAAPLLVVGDIATLHHGRFSKQCRPLLDQAVERQIGKHRTSMQSCIVIGTQTLEQSLDLDADFLITDLCPMDVLLQRVGRLHRHERPAHERPADYRSAQTLVLTPAAEAWPDYLVRSRHGLGRFAQGGGVYPDLRMLLATFQLLEEKPVRIIPQENRLLVECSTHPEALMAVAAAGGSAWQMHEQQIEGALSGERGMGYLHALEFDKPFEESIFGEGDEHIATRLGAADRLLNFEPPAVGPFGPVKQLTMRHYLLPKNLSPDAQPVVTATDERGFTFSLDQAHYGYSRVGVQKLSGE